jgi:hypothetical protein
MLLPNHCFLGFSSSWSSYAEVQIVELFFSCHVNFQWVLWLCFLVKTVFILQFLFNASGGHGEGKKGKEANARYW